ncbi:MAG: hypothetical protein ACK5OB_01510 [Pirellula sp.]|jgi:hypothetical protein
MSKANRRVPTANQLRVGMSDVSLSTIAWQTLEISQRWTQLQRCERRRSGTARRLWILNLIHLFPRIVD